MIAPEMPSETRTTTTSTIVIVPVQEAFSLFTRRSSPADHPRIQAKCAARRGSPDYTYYHKVAARPDSGKNPTLAVERKILRRSYHTLRELGDAALALPDTGPQEVAA